MKRGRKPLDPNRPHHCSVGGVLLILGVNWPLSRAKANRNICNAHYAEYQRAYNARKKLPPKPKPPRACKCGVVLPPDRKDSRCIDCRREWHRTYKRPSRAIAIQSDDPMPEVAEHNILSMSAERQATIARVREQMVSLGVEEKLSKPPAKTTVVLRVLDK